MTISTYARRFAAFVGLCLSVSPIQAKKSPPPDHWVGAWATANFARPNTPKPLNTADTTYREIVHTTLAGDLVRIELSNEFGAEPLTIAAAHVALSDAAQGKPTDIDLISANALTFHKSASVTIPPHAVAISDPFALKLPAGADLAVSLFVPAQTLSVLTWHSGALTTSIAAPGNVVAKASLADPAYNAHKMTSWFFLKSVDVETAPDTGAIVCFGDSITDGAGSTLDAHRGWPSLLAARLQQDPATRGLAVLNEGIGGNRVLHDGVGPMATTRFDRDVLDQPGARAVILLESINDIGAAANPTSPHDIVSAGDLIAAFTELAGRAHARGLKVYAGTLTPYQGARYESPAGEQMRETINTWIRTTKDLDGFFDFARALADPDHPLMFAPRFDSGDHLHPSDAGYQAMADAIDLHTLASLTSPPATK